MTNSNKTEKRKPWKIRIRIRTCLSGFGLWRKNDRHKSISALSVFYSSRIHLTVNPVNLKNVIRWIIAICYHGRCPICQSYCFLCCFFVSISNGAACIPKEKEANRNHNFYRQKIFKPIIKIVAYHLAHFCLNVIYCNPYHCFRIILPVSSCVQMSVDFHWLFFVS